MKQTAGTTALGLGHGTRGLASSPQACMLAGADWSGGEPGGVFQHCVSPASWPDATRGPPQPGAGKPGGFGDSTA